MGVTSDPAIITADAQSLPLFRQEVLAGRNGHWAGSISLAQPASGWLMACIALSLSAALLTYLTLGSVTRKAHVSGLIVPSGGSLSILAPNAGVLKRRFVAEGVQVTAGQPLFELSTERQGDGGEISALVSQQLTIRQETIEAERRLRIAQSQDKRHAMDERLQSLAEELVQLDQEIDFAQRRKALAQKTLGKYQTLETNGFVSAAQSQQKQEELIDLDARLATLARSKVQLESTTLSISADRKELGTALSADLAQLQLSAASLRQEILENQNRKTNLIVAPDDGVVTTFVYDQGQAVNTGQVLATLVRITDRTTSDLEVHLYTPSRSAGFVAVGQSVLLRYQAYPYQKFGLQQGIVTDVSKTPFAPGELPASFASTILSNAQQNISGVNINEALYRVKVRILKQSITAYGREQQLKPGMTVDADIVQENRKIWEWILEPILAAAR